MVEIEYTIQAINDINHILEFIQRDSERYAKIQGLRFFERIEILKTHPLSGTIVPETNDPSIRELIMGSYRIIYQVISASRIVILAIHHSSRLFKSESILL